MAKQQRQSSELPCLTWGLTRWSTGPTVDGRRDIGEFNYQRLGDGSQRRSVSRAGAQPIGVVGRQNMSVAFRLHAPDFHLITPTGASYTREEYLGKVEAGELNYLNWQPGEISVRLFADVALLRYRADLEMGSRREGASSFSCWHTDSYEKRGGTWQVVLSHATLVR